MEDQKVIVKKPRKHEEHPAHGGSWKVAYADFVTAMMAFFLLMWLINMTSPDQKAQVSYYFKNFSLFDKGGTAVLQNPEGTPADVSAFKELSAKDNAGSAGDNNSGQQDNASAEKLQKISTEELKEQLVADVALKLDDVKDQVLIEVFEGGVRIQLVDKESSLMFPLGSDEPTPKARAILKVITDTIKANDARIAVEGHTDARPYPSKLYTNWELSTDRASAARRELERNGLDTNRIMRVTGYADTQPLIKESPLDPRNRRISLLLFAGPLGKQKSDGDFASHLSDPTPLKSRPSAF